MIFKGSSHVISQSFPEIIVEKYSAQMKRGDIGNWI